MLFCEQNNDMMVDSFDKELISLLEQDARQSSDKLAEQLSISSSTVRRRMNELIKGGVIRIIAIPEPKQIGLPLTVVIAFQILHEKLSSVLKALGSRKDVKYICVTSGRFDVIAIMWFAATEQLYDFIEGEIPKIDGIKATETFVCLHIEKSF